MSVREKAITYILHLHITFNYRKKCTFCIPFSLNNCEKARGVMLQVRKQAEKATCMVGEPGTLHSKITVLSTKKICTSPQTRFSEP